MKVSAIASKLKRSFYVCLMALLLCSSLVIGTAQPAFAGNRAANIAQNRAEQALDEVAGAGTAEQIKGRAEGDLGRVQRKVGQVTGQPADRVEGAAKQVQGRAKKDIGRTQAAAEDAAEQIEDTSEGLIDSVKDFFN